MIRTLGTRCLPSLRSAAASKTACVRPLSFVVGKDDESLLKKYLKVGTSMPISPDTTSAFETISLSKDDDHIAHLALNRPKSRNAMSMQMWEELREAFDCIEHDASVRAVILSGSGPSFTAGMDLNVFAMMQKVANEESCEARKREGLMRVIDNFQHVISAPERCRVPVIASVHGHCIGAGLDLITACDLRYTETSATFSVREVELAIVADIGTLQRLPNLVGEQQAKELSFTGRDFSGQEAESMGLALRSLHDKEELDDYVSKVAKDIASKSPLTVRGIKQTIHYQRDHTTSDALQQVSYHNASTLYSDDLVQAFSAIMGKTSPTFRND